MMHCYKNNLQCPKLTSHNAFKGVITVKASAFKSKDTQKATINKKHNILHGLYKNYI